MSRKILKQEYLPLILRYFSQNPQERNAKHFQASLVAVTFDRLTSTHIYRLFSKTAEQANIGRLLKALQDVLRNSTKNYQEDSEEPQIVLDDSVLHCLSKIAALSKHSLPVQGEMKKLRQLILFNELKYSDVQILVKLAPSLSLADSSLTLADLITGNQLFTSPLKLYPSQIVSISRHIFPILAHRQKNILKSKIEEDINLYSRCQLEELCFPDNSCLLPLLKKQGFLENSPIKKRIIYRLMLIFMGQQSRIQAIPGKNCQTEEEVNQAVAFIRTLGRMVPFIDLFQTDARTAASLKDKYGLYWFGKYIDYYCIFVENGYMKLSCQQIKTCIQKLRKPCQEQIYGLLMSQSSLTVLKTLILFSTFDHYPQLQVQKSQLQMIIRSCLDILNSQKVKNIQFSGSTQRFLKLVGCFIIDELNKHLIAWKQTHIPNHALSLQTISVIVSCLLRQSQTSLILQLPSIYNYAKTMSFTNTANRTLSPSILYSDTIPKEKLQQLVDMFLDLSEVNIVNTQNILMHLHKHYTIHTKVILQPCFQLSYLIAQKETRQPLYAFDVASLPSQSCVYEGDIKEGQDLILQNQDRYLNPYGLWKYQWIQEVLRLKYFYCLSEEELAIKMCKAIGINEMIRR